MSTKIAPQSLRWRSNHKIVTFFAIHGVSFFLFLRFSGLNRIRRKHWSVVCSESVRQTINSGGEISDRNKQGSPIYSGQWLPSPISDYWSYHNQGLLCRWLLWSLRTVYRKHVLLILRRLPRTFEGARPQSENPSRGDPSRGSPMVHIAGELTTSNPWEKKRWEGEQARDTEFHSHRILGRNVPILFIRGILIIL